MLVHVHSDDFIAHGRGLGQRNVKKAATPTRKSNSVANMSSRGTGAAEGGAKTGESAEELAFLDRMINEFQS